MVQSFVLRLVQLCVRHAVTTLILAAVVCAGAGYYAATHFQMNTNSSDLISPDVEWRRNERAFNTAFPNLSADLVVVIDAATPDQADAAAAQLEQKLATLPASVGSVRQSSTDAFFEQNGLLFLATDEVKRLTTTLAGAELFLFPIAADPTLRGLTDAVGQVGASIGGGDTPEHAYDKPIQAITAAIESAIAGHPTPLSWDKLLTGGAADKRGTRRLILYRPKLDFAALQPGEEAADAIRNAAKDIGLTPEKGVRVRLTGDVPMADEEFGTLAEGAALNGILTVIAVLVILWLALRSGRIIIAVVASLIVGLAVTAALGLLMVGAFNLISVAFAVLFVGLGVDFGIQFAVRYREERFIAGELRESLRSAAVKVGRPLALAAVAIMVGFFSFLPTSYRGLSELGLIAGTGMVVAFLTSVTVLPALIYLLRPPGEPDAVGFRFLAPVDRFTTRYRMPILILTLIVVLAGLPLLWMVRFDFNPIHLRSASVESVATFLDLMRDPDTNPATVHLMRPSLAEAQDVAAKLDKLPEVSRSMTLASFVPEEQDQKLAAIEAARTKLKDVFAPGERPPPPTDAETVAALRRLGDAITKRVAADVPIGKFGRSLVTLANATPEVRQSAQEALFSGFPATLDRLRTSLEAKPVNLDSLPADLKSEWVAADGRAAVQAFPKGDANDNRVLRGFADATRTIAPDATGYPVTIQDAGETVVRAFLQAGALALVSITILLFLVLRRVVDVLLTLVPLIVAGVVTLELTVLLGLPLNFANIIALPLLLGVGVAFKVYFVMAWRSGQTNLLQSSLTRAVLYSAATTAVAFGSLWFSHHPGTSSMGGLLALSLVCTLAAAVLFQPLLMGPPRQVQPDA